MAVLGRFTKAVVGNDIWKYSFIFRLQCIQMTDNRRRLEGARGPLDIPVPEELHILGMETNMENLFTIIKFNFDL